MMHAWQYWQADIVLFVGLALLAFYVWRMAHALAEMHQDHRRLRERVEHLPSAALMADLRVQLGRLEALGESTQRELHINSTRLGRMEDYLMEAKRHGDDV